MKREELKVLDLSDEQINSVMGLHGKTVGEINAKLATAEQQATQYQEQLTNNQAELTALKESANGNEELTKQLADLQAKFDESETNAKTTINELRKQSAIELELTKAGAKNVTAVKALIDADKLEVADDGIKGLSEQLQAIKKENDFLFGTASIQQIVAGGNPNNNSTPEKSITQKIKERLGE